MIDNKTSVLVLGSNGMLGFDLFQTLQKMSVDSSSMIGKVIGLDVDDGYDFTQPGTLTEVFQRIGTFDYVINCIAYTNTGLAETTEDGKDLSYELNAVVPKNLAAECDSLDAYLIHISTDWVFSQKFGEMRFKPDNIPYPTSVYGKDKLLGEVFIQNEFKDHPEMFSILRVSWLYGDHNKKSFIHKFLKNIKNHVDRGEFTVEVTSNEYSIPTSTKYVIDCILKTVIEHKSGILHAVPSLVNGVVSRFDYASFILKCLACDEFKNVQLVPVERESYWPQHSTLETSFGNMTWIDDLKRFMDGKTLNSLIALPLL